jgi:hypothetical protein
MPDPFLENHRIGANHFSIGGKLSPVSIRDQLIRSQLFIDRAFEQKLLRDDGSTRLAVIGSGIGAAGAMSF